MREEYREFVGIYDDSVPVKLCKSFVKDYEEAKENRSIIDLSKENKSGYQEKYHLLARKDEVAYVNPLQSTMYPVPPVRTYFKFLTDCFRCYVAKYGIVFHGPIHNDVFKIHKVRKSEGFHSWHYEKADGFHLDRFVAYMTYLEVPEKGGETEFFHQSLRIDPVVGRTLIWPAGFTHMHRGNPPLDGEKMYITGWFTVGREDNRDIIGK